MFTEWDEIRMRWRAGVAREKAQRLRTKIATDRDARWYTAEHRKTYVFDVTAQSFEAIAETLRRVRESKRPWSKAK